nr:LysE family transporter [Allomuricauda sp.]
MSTYTKVFFSGLLVSFLGALPLGTLNLTAFEIAASQTLVSALWFALAVVLVELAIVRLTLLGSERILLGSRFVNYLYPLGIGLLLYLSVTSFLATTEVSALESQLTLLPRFGSAFVLGMMLSALNPLQIPFWFTWNKVLRSKGILNNSTSSNNLYLIGIGLGTLMALVLFIGLGRFAFAKYQDYAHLINVLMGLLYLGFAIYLTFLFYKKRLKFKTP